MPRWFGFFGMAALLVMACAMGGSIGAVQQSGSEAPAPNWTQATLEEVHEAEEADRLAQRAPRDGEIAFTFTLSEAARATSAGVYDAQNHLVRTLWSARPYAAGAHRALWDGRDDYGQTTAPATYTIKVLSGNVHYDWEGAIGVTEDSLAGPHNWDASASFPSSMTFLGGKAYVAGGYNEGRIEAYVFDEKSPFTLTPLNMALFTGGQFEYAATDGQRIYFASLHYWANGSNAVVAFWPDGRPYSFPQGTVIPQMDHLGAYFINTRMEPPLAIKGMRGLEVADFRTTTVTGLAVQRDGNLLAAARGARGGARMTASLDTIDLFDKNSGAPAGSVTGIPNPQRMVFDLNGDLWVIEGGPTVDWYWDRGAKLARVRGVGGRNEIAEPIQGLDNPVDVAVNPVNGHIFVADGGASQQVKEFDPATAKQVGAVGKPGGYGQGADCNATITPDTFWLDYNARATGVTQPWIAVDETGDLWVGDFTTNRILRFHQGKLAGLIEMNRWLYFVSVPQNSPTRVFGGIRGMLEYEVDYNVPLEPTDSIAPGATHSWHAVRNWLPCFISQEGGEHDRTDAHLSTAETFRNGETFGMVGYHGGAFNNDNALVKLPTSGKLEFVNNRITVYRMVGFDPDGNFYRNDHTGPAQDQAFTIRRYAITGYDARGFPEWDNGTAIASYTADLAAGNPVAACSAPDGCTFRPTQGGIIPVFAGLGFDRAVAHGDPAFHLGGLPVNGTALAWQAMPEKSLRFPDGHGSYPTAKDINFGIEARALHRDIFAGVNGNWSWFSCQFYHYREDGLLVGQFGWRGQEQYHGMSLGRPDPMNNQAHAPGFCGNPLMFKIVSVGNDDYLYTADEGYRAGLQRWRISNLASIREMTGTAVMGASVELKDAH